MSNYIGIDLGTTNTVCCTVTRGKFDFIKFRLKDILPSALLYKDGKVTVGEKARKKAVVFAENYLGSTKTFMGDHGKSWQLEDRLFTPTDAAMEILKEVKAAADTHFSNGEKMAAVITVPAYFSSNQFDETRRAASGAGLEVMRIITEPVAAAIAYGFEENVDQRLFIVDIGGGTFDVSVLEKKDNQYQTLTIDGDKHLGGDNFDAVILDFFYSEIRKNFGVDLSNLKKSGLPADAYYQARQKLINEAETCKIELSACEECDVQIPNLFSNKGTNVNFSTKISRKQFEEKSATLMNKIKKTIENTLNGNSLSSGQIDKVILVGGSANIPMIYNYIKELFGRSPYSDKDLSRLVAMGAALLAQNQDRAITTRIDIKDIISHSLGIETVGNKFEKILEKNSFYPITRAKLFTTIMDYQKTVTINVFEGENCDNAESNEFYGGFDLPDIEKEKKGVPRIEVTFEFGKDRILYVKARDLKTNSTKNQEFKEIKINKGQKSRQEV